MQKVESSLKAARKFRKNATLLAKCIEKKIESNRHRYTAVSGGPLIPFGGAKLPSTTWEPDEDQCSVNLEGFASAKATTDHFSPACANVGLPVADQGMLRHLRAFGTMDELHCAWMGRLCSWKHKFVVAFIDPRKPLEVEGWFFPLHNYDSSGVLLWPVWLREVAGTPRMLCEFDLEVFVFVFGRALRNWS